MTAAALTKRVLIVEDELEIGQAVRRILEKERLDVELSASADAALDWIRHEPVDLVVTDLNMPGKSGMDLIRTLHGERPELKVIVLTACNEEDYRREAVASGAVEYIVKPMRRNDLVRAVRSALGMGDDGAGETSGTGAPVGGTV